MQTFTDIFQSDAPTPRPAPSPQPQPQAAPQPPSGPVGMPWDGVYQQTLANNQLGYQNTLAGLNQQQGQLQTSFGFNAQGGFDPSNPFSKAALLKTAFQNAARRSTTQMAARGQLYAGSLQNAQNTNSYNYNKGYDTLRSGYQNALAKIQQQRATAQQQLQSNDTNALGTSLSNALAQQATQTQTPVVNVSSSESGVKPSKSIGSGGKLKQPKPKKIKFR